MGLCVASLATLRKPGARALRLSCFPCAEAPARRELEPLRARVVAEPRLQPTGSSPTTSTLANLLTRPRTRPMFEILVGSLRSQFRYAKKAGEQPLSGFLIVNVRAFPSAARI